MIRQKNESAINTTAKLWISHILVYYFVFGCLYNFIISYCSVTSFIESIKMILVSPLIGLMGFYDLFPGFTLIPIIVMIGVRRYIYIDQLYKSYLVSILFVRAVHYILMACTGTTNFPFLTTTKIEINVLLLIIPSLAVTLLINWFLFGRYENRN